MHDPLSTIESINRDRKGEARSVINDMINVPPPYIPVEEFQPKHIKRDPLAIIHFL